MYAADHLPPHFHVRMQDGREALINIADLSILSGRITRRELREVLDWAKQHQAELSKIWEELNS